MNIGLLMSYNERDIIEEMMESNRGHVDTIFALDGSDDDPDPRQPVQQRGRWYSPAGSRSASSRAAPGRVIGSVLPSGVGWRPYSRMPLLKHYPYRSPEQMTARLARMRERGFSGTPAETTIHRLRYAGEYRRAERFEGDFDDLELDRQGNLLTMWWRWKRWVR